MTVISQDISEAVKILKIGGLVAYPTEAVYGLGCDPFNQRAVEHLLLVKQRSISKGFILITHSWRLIQDLLRPIDPSRLTQVLATWPGPATWVFPATQRVPDWILGSHQTVAVRVTNHPIAKQLCENFRSPIVSTSANTSQQPPARAYETVQERFDGKIDYILEGATGNLPNPTPIRDAMTGKVIRV